MSDLALGIVVFTFAAVPASLLLLALADVIRLEGEGVRRRWIRNCLWALAVPATIPLGSAAWGWAGAAHLEPLCQAYAAPEFRSERSIAARALLIDSDTTNSLSVKNSGSTKSTELAPWALAITQRLVEPQGPLSFVGSASPSLSGQSSVVSANAEGTLVLEARRVLHHENLWFRVEMERFRLVDRSLGLTMALADELWIIAGRSRYHCGIISGRIPTQTTSWPGGDGVAKFVQRALAGQRKLLTNGLPTEPKS